MKDLKERIEAVYKRANDLSGGNLDILKTAILSFNDALIVSEVVHLQR